MRPLKKVLSVLLTVCLVFSMFIGCAKDSFTVTFDANGGVLTGESTITKESGQSISQDELPTAAREGYIFIGWFTDSDATGSATTFPYKVTKNIKFYAGWEEDEEPTTPEVFTITFNANGGELDGDATITKESGQSLSQDELPTATRDGFEFVGWFADAEATQAITFPYDVTQNITLYAGWEEAAEMQEYLFEAETLGVVTGSPSYGDGFYEAASLASGGAVLANLGTEGNAVEFVFNAEKAGTANIEFVFSSTNFIFGEGFTLTVIDHAISPSTLKIELNSNELIYDETVIPGSGEPNGFNLVFESLIIENVALVQGQNSVKVTALTNSFPNFDCLIVHTNIELDYDDSEPVDSVYEGEVSFKLIVGAHPGGPAVEKAILHFEDQVSSDLLEGKTFVISHSAPGWGGNMQVTKMNASNAYLSDADGAEIQGSESNYVTVEYSVQYGTYSFLANNSAFVYNFTSSLNTWIDEATLAVSINSGKTVKIDGVEYNQLLAEKVTFDEFVVPSLENWKLDGTHTYEDDEYGEITLKYAAYEPESLSGDQKNPLIIWLHGAGEGGTDPTIVLLGNEVTYLANDEIQSYFTSGSQTGAYILAVQSPTMWMDNGTGQYGDGSTSKYTDALWSTIRAYVQDNGDIDETRIYVGGCSNGGFMTMNMLITDTEDFFAAAFPICQAYNYSKIDAETKEKLAQKAIWFTHAANDPTVDPNSYTNKLYVDLINAGAENVYYSYFEDVTYDGTSYDGHWSWIYTLRNECKNIQPTQAEEGDLTVSDLDPTSTLTHDTYETLWAWMAAQQNTK